MFQSSGILHLACAMTEWTMAAALRLERLARVHKDQAGLAAAAGISRTTLHRIFKGANPGEDRLELLAQTLGVTCYYILNGREVEVGTVEVPVYKVQVAAGAGRENEELSPVSSWPFPGDWLHAHFGHAARLEIVEVKGDSQEPILSDGDALMYDRNKRRLAEGLHVVRYDDQLLIKSIRIDGRSVYLVSANKTYEDKHIDLEAEADGFEILGRAVWAGKKL